MPIFIEALGSRLDNAVFRLYNLMLDCGECIVTLEADPIGTNRLWFIKFAQTITPSDSRVICTVMDSSEAEALLVMKQVVIFLLVLGISVKSDEDEEFGFDPEDYKTMEKFEQFFMNNSSFSIDVKNENTVVCFARGEELDFISLRDISSRGIWIIAKQLTMLLASQGNIVTLMDDGTSVNRYGMIDFCQFILKDEEEQD